MSHWIPVTAAALAVGALTWTLWALTAAVADDRAKDDKPSLDTFVHCQWMPHDVLCCWRPNSSGGAISCAQVPGGSTR
jgi:hypothetical protein